MLFQKTANELLEVAQQFQTLLKHLETPQLYIAAIDAHEEAADQITISTLAKLHKTFITPFDRYDIHRFVKKLDDVIDAIQRTSQRLLIYQLKTVPPEIHSMASLCLHSAQIIQAVTDQLHSLKNATTILEFTDKVNHYENEAETLLLAGVSKLFQEEMDLRQLLKTKEIYESCKAIMNGFQTVANIIKDIVLEYS